MSGDSVTLHLDGTIAVGTFARAAAKFSNMLDELLKEASAVDRVDWTLSGLEFGSALLTASPIPRTADDELFVPRLVDRYLEAAQQVQDHPVSLDRPVLRLVHDISRLASDAEHEVVFETADGDVTFSPAQGPASQGPTPSPPVFGTIRGRVQTLQQRRGLRFVLYDELHDRAVTCYLQAGEQDRMRDAWGRLVEVSGMVTRDPISDRPRSIRQVTDVRVYEEPEPFAFRRARGAIRLAGDSPPSEVVIRRVRDVV